MSDPTETIERFRKMAEADPDNELGHFSLGRALLEAGRSAEAAESLDRCIALNPFISKAYALLGQALLKQNARDRAIEVLTKGVITADKRGDSLPRNEMSQMLRDLGAAVPETMSVKPEQPVGEGQIQCKRCGRAAPRLPNPPFRNAQGKLIHDNVCPACWKEWIGMGTKVINELRLPLSDPRAQKLFDQHMLEFLNLK